MKEEGETDRLTDRQAFGPFSPGSHLRFFP